MAGVHPVSTEFINLDTNRVPRAQKNWYGNIVFV
jgi:hypothetical protein